MAASIEEILKEDLAVKLVTAKDSSTVSSEMVI